MPTYQYRCTNCDADLEVVQKFSDPSLTECPECGGTLRKVFNAVGVVFKGSGFYKTDSRSSSRSEGGSSKKSSDAASSSSSSDSSGGSDSSSDSSSSTSGSGTSSSAGAPSAS